MGGGRYMIVLGAVTLKYSDTVILVGYSLQGGARGYRLFWQYSRSRPKVTKF